jgi:hypothetical protein
MPNLTTSQLILGIIESGKEPTNRQILIAMDDGFKAVGKRFTDVDQKLGRVDEKADTAAVKAEAAAKNSEIAATQATKTNGRVDKLEGRSKWPVWLVTFTRWMGPSGYIILGAFVFHLYHQLYETKEVIKEVQQATIPTDRH